MADKFRQTFPIAVSFSEGELPTSSKLTGLATQARSGQGVMQYAIGDLWNQGGDSMLTDTSDLGRTALMIPSLARYLGASKHASPLLPALPDIEEVSFKFTNYVGEYEAVLPFPLASGAGTPTWSGTGAPSVKKSTRGAVTLGTDYFIDDAGRIFTYSAMATDWIITYEPQVDGNVGADSTFNVIPDPRTDAVWGFLGLKIQFKNGTDNSDGYYVYLPPRMPHYNYNDADKPNWYLEPTNNVSSSPTTEKLFWLDVTAACPTGANAEHYRYKLPEIVTGSSDWAAGVDLPSGLFYLWDEFSTGTILEGVTFTAMLGSATTWGLYIPYGTPLDSWLAGTYGSTVYTTALLQASTHTQADYPNTGLKLITVGSDVSQLISSLMQQFLAHDHSTPHSLPGQPIDHGKLAGSFYKGGTPVLHNSGYYDDGDNHPQYLERHGYSLSRDKYGNAMLGDLVMASTSSANNYLNTTSASNKIYFGSTSGTVIKQDSAGSCQIESPGGIRLDGQGGHIQLWANNIVDINSGDGVDIDAAGSFVVDASSIELDANGHMLLDTDNSGNITLSPSGSLRFTKAPVATGNGSFRYTIWPSLYLYTQYASWVSSNYREVLVWQNNAGAIDIGFSGFPYGARVGSIRSYGAYNFYNSSYAPTTRYWIRKTTSLGDTSGGWIGSSGSGNLYRGGRLYNFAMSDQTMGHDDVLHLRVYEGWRPYYQGFTLFLQTLSLHPYFECNMRISAGYPWTVLH